MVTEMPVCIYNEKKIMIYVANTGVKQTIAIPRSFYRHNGLTYHLKISQADKAIYATNLTDLGGSWLYYCFEIDLPKEVVSGEYEYLLISEKGETASEGIMVVEWDRPYNAEFEKFVEYEQYGEK